MGRTSLRWEATAEPPAGEHSEGSESGALGGERAPAGVEEADGWWDVVPQSTAIRAPQVLLWLTDREVGAEEAAVLFLGVDWGEAHHDLCLLDQDGSVIAARRIADGLADAADPGIAVAAATQPQIAA